MTETHQVIWTAGSRRDLERINAYISQFRPLAAQRFALRLVSATESLAENPHRGLTVGPNLREMLIVRLYRIRYRITPERIEILRVRHGAREPN